MDLIWAAGLALFASAAYLRPFAWLAWLLGVSVGASWFVLIGAALAVAPGRRSGDPVPVWMDNALALICILFAAPLAVHAARFAKRRFEA